VSEIDGRALRLPDPCLVVLVGASGAGKSHWARTWFAPDQIVSSDRLRAIVGTGERDQRASRDAFELLDLIVAKRLQRGLTTVIDTTGLEAERRDGWRAEAARHGVAAYAVVFDTPAAVVRERNRVRGTPVPANASRAPRRATRRESSPRSCATPAAPPSGWRARASRRSIAAARRSSSCRRRC